MKVQHDPKNQRFFLKLGSDEAFLAYDKQGMVLDFSYIYTPVHQRNRGVAGRILKAAFEYAREEGYRVIPSCPIIRYEFLPRFTKYQDLVESSG